VHDALHRLGLTSKSKMETLIKAIPEQAVIKEFAPGIPEEKDVKPLPKVKKPQDWMYSIQRHKAQRAGEHVDLRLVDPKTEQAHSWAIPSAKLPEPGKSVMAIRQPTHTMEYALNFGRGKERKIEKGYGAGTVKIEDISPIEVFHSTPDDTGTLMRFNIYRGTHPEEYAVISTKKGPDRLVNKTLTKERLKHLPIGAKPSLKEIDINQVDINDESQVMLPKLDGAHGLIDLQKPERIPRIFSYREAKRAPTGVIEHTHKIPEALALRTPKNLKGTVLRAEIIGVDRKGKSIPASEVGGLLNASVVTSRKKQQKDKVKLRPVAFDIVKYKNRLVNHLPFPERYALLKEIEKETKLHIADMASTSLEKQKLLDQINSKRYPLTREGVILQDIAKAGKATKAKHTIDHDVHVREIFPAISKSGDKLDRAGGFSYSWTPRGKIVGRVGTGFEHTLARDMLQNPDKYKGRVAKVVAEQKYESGALGKPRFNEWHIEKGV